MFGGNLPDNDQVHVGPHHNEEALAVLQREQKQQTAF